MFATRLLSGTVLMAIAFVSFRVGTPLLPAVLYAVSLIGFLEMTKALGLRQEGQKHAGLPELAGIIALTAYYGALLLGDFGVLAVERSALLLPCILFFFLGEMLAYVLMFPRLRVESVMASIFAFLYVPVTLSFIDLIRMREKGVFLVWLVFISAWGSDTCAYCVGVLVGRKRIFPHLSPKKTLEGCVGGIAGAALIGAAYAACMGARESGYLCLIALICGLGGMIGMAGDLAASAVKRNRNIKDYGKLIPGHGGIVDRFDSVIATAPLTYFLIVFLLGK